MDINVSSKLLESVYNDLCHPAASQVGKVLEDIFKALRLLSLPFQALGFIQDKIDRMRETALQQVPEEDLVLPPGQVIFKIYQEIQLYHDNSLHMELFTELFSCFINKKRLYEAHPAFILIIPQLSEDEIKMLSLMKKDTFLMQEKLRYDRNVNLFTGSEVIENKFPVDLLTYGKNLLMYISHLYSLNLAGCWQSGNQIPIRDENNTQIGTIKNSEFRLTDFGQLFVQACIK